nr:hypothetical protein [Dictyobacter formicarum]
MCWIGASFSFLYFFSQFLQNGRGYSPFQTGIAFLPLPLARLLRKLAAAVHSRNGYCRGYRRGRRRSRTVAWLVSRPGCRGSRRQSRQLRRLQSVRRRPGILGCPQANGIDLC